MLLEHFTHNTRVRVPWSAIHKYPDEYISEECIPDDVTIRDPSKLLLSEVKKLWKLWRDRQKNGQVPLLFISCLKNHMREAPDMSNRPLEGRDVHTEGLNHNIVVRRIVARNPEDLATCKCIAPSFQCLAAH